MSLPTLPSPVPGHFVLDALYLGAHPAIIRHLLHSGPPDHTGLRRSIAEAFTGHRVEHLESRVRQIADELLDHIELKSDVDLVAEFAAPLSIAVVCELLDVPLDDHDEFRRCAEALLAGEDAEAVRSSGDVVVRHLVGLVADRRAHPGDDFFSALVHADDQLDDLVSSALLLLVACHETTVDLITDGVRALLPADKLDEHPLFDRGVHDDVAAPLAGVAARIAIGSLLERRTR
ncbi:hypothetical protein AB0M48_05740 [Lentzea sp. NPDC051208]|uniref:hypothetical protein n=1 Tax=Lentzea sp. NPDC051208 TaxID=3154642 RepID=UPI003443E1DD